MIRRSHKRRSVDDAELESLRDVYAGLGLGFPAAALRIFGGEDGGENGGDDGEWCLHRRGLTRTLRCLRASELSNRELFALPPAWEIMRVVARDVTARGTKHGDLVSVGGDLYCRHAGSWDHLRLPFFHLWTMRAGRALRFENLIDDTELTRPRSRRRSAERYGDARS
jgi:hypothetical protein